jgi:ABC-type Mn2+/Zn2+ transport system permease subunit
MLISAHTLAMSDFTSATLPLVISTGAVGIAAAVLSVFVVLRRWAFLGEGIAHAGYGGIGTAALLTIPFSALNNYAASYLIGAIFALATAFCIAWISRRRAVSTDSAVGVFVAAALAWGFIAFSIQSHLGRGGSGGWENYLIGNIYAVSSATAALAIAFSAAIVIIVALLRRQIVFYTFDPTLAEVSGVPVGFIHYLLVLLVALVIIAAWQVVGNLLVSALIVLPGAAGLAVSRKMRVVMTVAIVSNCVATLLGILVARHWPFIAPGPAIVGILFLEFLVAYLLRNRSEEA